MDTKVCGSQNRSGLSLHELTYPGWAMRIYLIIHVKKNKDINSAQIVSRRVQNIRCEVYFSRPCTSRQIQTVVKNNTSTLLMYAFDYIQTRTPCGRVLWSIVTKLVKEFPASYWTRRFITLFTGAATTPYHEPDESNPYRFSVACRSKESKSEALCNVSLTGCF
jgi:hypothetical protein